MVLKIGGTNGSGKTTLVRAMMEAPRKFTPLAETRNGKVLSYIAAVTPTDVLHAVFDTVVVLGSYATVCGGMDTIADKNKRLALLEPYNTKAHLRTLVVYEGLITGKTYGAMGAMSEAGQVPWVYAFMDTPFDVCVARVLKRRAARGTDTPFDAERTMRPTYRSVEATARRAADAWHTVVWVDHRLPAPKAVAKLLLQAVKAQAVWTA